MGLGVVWSDLYDTHVDKQRTRPSQVAFCRPPPSNFPSMPAATFSRRNASKRQASSDIEEDQPTQQRAREAVDDEDDEDEQPRRRVNGVKKEKKVTSSRTKKPPKDDDADEDDEEEEKEDDDDDDDKIDVRNFHDQSLSRADLPKLQGLSKDWQQMEKQVQQNWSVIVDVAASVADAAEGDDAEAVCSDFLWCTNFCMTFSRALKNST